jgi:hypothetical protein
MIKLRNLHWWTGAVLFTLMISVVLFAYVARRPLCIDSKLVESIDSVSNSGTATAYRCALRRHVPYDETLAQQISELGPRLQSLERLIDWLGPLQNRVNLTILNGAGETYRIQGQEVFISESFLKSQGQIEKTLLRVWYRERASLDLQASPLIEESLTDFLYFAYHGDFDLQDAKTGLLLDEDLEPKWPRVLSNWSGYCHSLWRSNDDLKVCGDLNSFSDDGIHLSSLRPLISQTLMNSYAELNASERLQFIVSFAKSLHEFSFHAKNFGLSPLQLHQKSYFEAVSQLENWSYFLAHLGPRVAHAEKFSALFNLELKKHGFDSFTQQALLDTLVFTDELNTAQKKSLIREIDQEKSQLIGIESQGSLQMSLTGEPLNLKLLGLIQASNGIYLHCGQPDLKKVHELSKRVEKLLYVNFCGDQVVYLKGYFEKGALSFARQNPGLKFAEFHMPSLMMALQKLPGQNPVQLLSEKKKGSLEPIGWKEPFYDEAANAYRAQSAIEMVDWFRM